MQERVLVVVHVYYPQHWEELAECVRGISEPKDVVVTFVDEAAADAPRRDFPEARFVRCENRGFDVWPFLRVLQETDLTRYGLVVKLHTKRDIDPALNFRFNRMRFVGPVWRERLLAFCRTPDAWQRTLRRFESPAVGMVAGGDVIVRRRDVTRADALHAFDAAAREVSSLGGRVFATERAQFVAGTMFAVRSDILRYVLQRGFRREMFVPSAHVAVEDMEYAHVVERLFGLAVSACGCRVVAFEGSLFWRRFLRRLGRS